MERLRIKRLSETAILPRRATPGSAGYDLAADIREPVVINPGETISVGTGVAIELSGEHLAGFVFGRSGLGIKHGIVPANAVGVIDSDYRGEIKVGLHNQSGVPYTVEPGERIAQLVIMPVLTPEPEEVRELSGTERGEGGFSSTGRR